MMLDVVRLTSVAGRRRSRWTPFEIGRAGANWIAQDAEARIAREVATLVRIRPAVDATDRVDGPISRFH